MKKIFGCIVLLVLIISCKTIQKTGGELKSSINVSLDLVEMNDDKIKVVIVPGKINEEELNFYIPQIIPGTYEYSNFGRFVEDFKALDSNGNDLEFEKLDENTWKILNAKNLNRITYWANDSFDGEIGSKIYPMGGVNFDEGKTFLLNLHGFIGYFEGKKNLPYNINVKKPNGLNGYTSLKSIPNSRANEDGFLASRYFEVIDNPILYTPQEAINFQLDEILVNFALYSPSGKHKASEYKATLEKMMKAQKKFLGDVNSTPRYDILLHLMTNDEVVRYGGMGGALEHHTSTTATFADDSDKEYMSETLIDVISHEFFHTLTPLAVHSKEIHNFEYNKAVMSKHLWMYEGSTEYFANLFQVNQGLISETDFLDRMNDKILNSLNYDDELSFTEMSSKIVDEPFASQYGNVYQKGALINMCLDIIIRENSGGEKGVLWLMKELSKKYGKDKPFDDESIINEIVELTYPEVSSFFEKHVVGNTPIDYSSFFTRVGVSSAKDVAKLKSIIMTGGGTPFFKVVGATETRLNMEVGKLNSSLEKLGLKVGDKVMAFDEAELLISNKTELNAKFTESFSWKEDKEFSIKIEREGKEMILKGKVGTPTDEIETYRIDKNNGAGKSAVRDAWLKG